MVDKVRKPRSGWTYQQTVDDLAMVPEIAEALGVTQRRVQMWIYRRPSTHCPRPVAKLRIGSIYSLAEWKGWWAFWRISRAPERMQLYRSTQD